jgi:hypothetical protein
MKTMSLVALALAAALLPASAAAATFSGEETGLAGLPGHGALPASDAPVPPARTILAVDSSFDSSTGTWTTSVTFGARQSTVTRARLYLGLQARTPGMAFASLQAWTDPSAPDPSYAFFPPSSQAGTPSPRSQAQATATFSDNDSVMTVTVRDPALVGLPLNELGNVRLSNAGVPDEMIPPLSLTAGGDQGTEPRVVLPASDRSLRVRANAISLALGSLTAPATVTAEVEINNRPIARTSQVVSSASAHVHLRLLRTAGSLLPAGEQRSAQVIVLVRSASSRESLAVGDVSIQRQS